MVQRGWLVGVLRKEGGLSCWGVCTLACKSKAEPRHLRSLTWMLGGG